MQQATTTTTRVQRCSNVAPRCRARCVNMDTTGGTSAALQPLLFETMTKGCDNDAGDTEVSGPCAARPRQAVTLHQRTCCSCNQHERQALRRAVASQYEAAPHGL
jgi:hypothetical protein